MKLISKTIMLFIVLVMASACSAAFDASGLSGDDAAMLSSALNVDLVNGSYDFDYTINLSVSADGDNLNVVTAGSAIHDAETGNGLLSFAGEISGMPELGGAAQPYDIEIRGIGETDLYVRGLAPIVDPSMDPATWFFLDVATTSQMATAGTPLGSTGLMTDGQLNVDGVYSALNDNLFGSTGSYLSATRLDDMNGMAHFQVNLEVGEWLSSDELQTALATIAPIMAGDLVSQDEIDSNLAQASMMMSMAGMMLSDGTYQFDYFVDPATGALSQSTVTIGISMDPAMMGGEGDPGTFDLVFDVMFRQFSADSVVVAPADFLDLTQMMGGG